MPRQLLTNARIYTLNPSQPSASALFIEGDRIWAVGDTSDFASGMVNKAEILDLRGQVIFPGFTDAHIHLEHYALIQAKIDCSTSTKDECLLRVKARTRETPPGVWIQGHGWNQNNWVEGFGTATDLDAVAPHHPVYLTAKSLHAAWVNTAALQIAGIDGTTPDPKDGQIQRGVTGNPTGILFEGAMKLVSEFIPEPDEAQLDQAILSAQTKLWQLGITGVHDYDRQLCFQTLLRLHAQSKLCLRVVKNIHLEYLPSAIEARLLSGLGDNWLRLGGVKMFADGALGPHTAAMFQAYSDEATNCGILLLNAEELFEYGRLASDNGLPMAIHAIGDRANHEVLNALEQLRAYESAHHLPALRHRIEHVQVIHPEDVSRLAELSVIASMQPIHATSDMPMVDRLCGERGKRAYAWRALIDAGTTLAFGSDAPVEDPNPFLGLYAAVTRRSADGSPAPEGWYPEQRLSVHQALIAYTQGPAYAAGMETTLGQLAPGYLADLIVLEKDPYTCDLDDLKDIHPVATMIGGEWVWGKKPSGS
ncbi:MAG: amidohydrolase [Chloroflexota bacterium]